MTDLLKQSKFFYQAFALSGILLVTFFVQRLQTLFLRILYSPSKHGRQHTISNTNQIKSNNYSTDKKHSKSSLQI